MPLTPLMFKGHPYTQDIIISTFNQYKSIIEIFHILFFSPSLQKSLCMTHDNSDQPHVLRDYHTAGTVSKGSVYLHQDHLECIWPFNPYNT